MHLIRSSGGIVLMNPNPLLGWCFIVGGLSLQLLVRMDGFALSWGNFWLRRYFLLANRAWCVDVAANRHLLVVLHGVDPARYFGVGFGVRCGIGDSPLA